MTGVVRDRCMACDIYKIVAIIYALTYFHSLEVI